VRDDELERGIALRNAGVEQPAQRERRLVRPGDGVGQPVVVDTRVVAATGEHRMHEHRHLESRRLRPERLEIGIVEIAADAGDPGPDHRADVSLRDRARQLGGGEPAILQRHRRERQIGDLTVRRFGE